MHSLPSGAHCTAYLLGKPLTPCPATWLTMQGKTEVSLPHTHSPCSTRSTVYTSLSRSLYLPLFLCCTYSIAHYRMFVNRSMCTIVAAFICADSIPCQLGPRPPCTAQRVPCVCIHVCIIIIVYSFIVHSDEHEYVSHHVLLIISWSLCVHEHACGYCLGL